MYEFYPLLILGAIIGAFTIVFTIAYATMKNKKEAIGFDRNVKDSEIIKRLLVYAKPHIKSFILVGFIMLLSISYEIISPLLIGKIQELLTKEFEMARLLAYVAVYAGILIVSLVSTYVQSIILQKVGQKILSNLREDVFMHIEGLSHSQLHQMPVGKLVTRVANDTNAISMMFTNLLVNLVKNCFTIVGVFGAMLLLNYQLTLMVLCFAPFILLFTVIFRKFTRRAFRKVKDATTDINTFLSENLSGIKITQIFNREDRKANEFEGKNSYLAKAKHQQIFVFGIFRPMVYMLYISSVLTLLYFSARGYIKDTTFLGQKITSDILVSFYMYTNKFFNPIQNLAEQFNRLQSAFASAEKIFTVLDMKPEVVDEPDAIELDTVRGEIEFKNVWFAYNEGECLRTFPSRSTPRKPLLLSARPAQARPPYSRLSAATTIFRRDRYLLTA